MASYQRRSHTEWQSLISTFESSGLSVKEFCKLKSISPASFYQWRQRLAEPTTAEADTLPTLPFIDMSALSAKGDLPWRIELELGDGVTLRFHRG